jgi:hypothetical protein
VESRPTGFPNWHISVAMIGLTSRRLVKGLMSASMRVNSESHSNEIDESELQDENILNKEFEHDKEL